MRHNDINMVIFNGIKCVLYGFIHGFFIDQNELQYILLIVVKIWLLVVNVRWSCLFEHEVLCVTSFLYYFAGVIIDTLCLMDNTGIIPEGLFKTMFNKYSGLNLAEFILLVVLVGTILTGVLFQFFRDLRMSLCPKDRK